MLLNLPEDRFLAKGETGGTNAIILALRSMLQLDKIFHRVRAFKGAHTDTIVYALTPKKL